MRRLLAALIGALCFARGASAQPAPTTPAPPPRATPPKDAVPDLAFLEYLGSWQGDDDEWLAIKEWDQDNAPRGAAGEHKKLAPDPARDERHDESK
jgi:hypothetical protein